MEITELRILPNFESCLQNPSSISRFNSIQFYSFCKWGALIVAFLATFTSLIIRIKLLILRFFTIKSLSSSSSSKHLLQTSDYDSDYSEYSDNDDDLSSSETEFDDEEIEDSTVDEQSNLWRCFSWSDFAAGKSVVKLWDGFGLGLDEISIWDLDRDEDKKYSFFGDGYEYENPSVILSAANVNKNSVLLSGYDKRMSRKTPAIYADWQQPGRQFIDVNSDGVSKVYVTDGITGGVTVGDMRKLKTPLENLTESDDDTLWDSDGVMY